MYHRGNNANKSRRRTTQNVALIAALCLLPFPMIGLADFNSANLRAAGFGAKNGEYDGKMLTGAERKKVEKAINLLKKLGTVGGQDIRKCAKCLEDMLKNGRICREDGTSKACAVTLPDKKAGCDPKKEGINVNKKIIDGDKCILAGTLVHEWCHTNQTDFRSEVELPCYQLEVAVQTALGKMPGSPVFDQAKRCLVNRMKAIEKKKKNNRTPAGGGRRITIPSGHYDVGSESTALASFPIADPVTTQSFFDLSMAFPLDLIVLEGVTTVADEEVLIVAGLDETDLNGVLQALTVKNGEVTGVIFTLELPMTNPFAMAYEPDTSFLYVLDLLNDQILRLEDTGSDGVPDTLAATPYATVSQVPELAEALSLSLNIAEDGRDLIVGFRDTRQSDVIDMDDDLLALFDDDGDAVVDSTSSPFVNRDLIAVLAGFGSSPSNGNMTVELFASAGADVEVRATDATGQVDGDLLGTGTVPVDSNSLTVGLNRALVVAEYIKAVDLTNTIDIAPPPALVGPLPNELNVLGAFPNEIPIGTPGSIKAFVLLDFAGLEGPGVLFTKVSGDFTFTNGVISPDGTQSIVVTDADGVAEVTFDGVSVGDALVEVSVIGAGQTAFSFFKIVVGLGPGPGGGGDGGGRNGGENGENSDGQSAEGDPIESPELGDGPEGDGSEPVEVPDNSGEQVDEEDSFPAAPVPPPFGFCGAGIGMTMLFSITGFLIQGFTLRRRRTATRRRRACQARRA